MAYSKRDFLNWNEDINLTDLLGEFTASECEAALSDEEMPLPPKKKAKRDNSNANKLYKCSECESQYSSVSGIRGHMQKKHGLTRVRASDYRQNGDHEDGKILGSKETPFMISTEEFSKTYNRVFIEALTQVSENQFRRLEFSVHGKGILNICELLMNNSDSITALAAITEPMFLKVFNTFADSACNQKEILFATFYELSTNMSNEMTSHLREIVHNQLPIRQFSGVLLHQILELLISERSVLYQKEEQSASKEISEADQSVLFYISGYIIRAVQKASRKHNVLPISDGIQALLQRESSAEKTFVGLHATWTEKINRGGLLIPSDNFFLLIRELENVCRKNVPDNDLTTNSFNKGVIKEHIIEDFMVKYYIEKLDIGNHSSFIIEKIVTLFLTIRGNACARLGKTRLLQSGETTKSVRQKLKDISNSK